MAERGKKTKHEGVFRKKSGAWLITVALRHQGGFKSLQRTLTKQHSEAEAVEARARLRVELEQCLQAGTVIQTSIASKPTTIGDFAEQWLKRKQADWRPKTRSDNLSVLAERILPHLGHIAVEELHRTHILAWRSWAESQKTEKGAPYAAGTLGLWWRVLRGMLGDLIVDHELNTNLVFKVKAPRSDKPRVRTDAALTAEQLGKLLSVVKGKHPGFYAEVFILAMAGCRPGELYALTWGDIDLLEGKLTISKSVVQGNVGKPKNGKTRIVALTDGMRVVLQAHKDQHPGLPAALVFPSEAGTHRSDTTLHHMLFECGQKVGIQFRVGPQVLRYTANTLLREAGVADEIVRDRLGHTTREMGHRYFKGHLEAQKAAVEKLHAAVEGGR